MDARGLASKTLFAHAIAGRHENDSIVAGRLGRSLWVQG